MNIESLKYFYMIAKGGSISNVAKEVHISQSALSQQIQKLEGDLGQKLLLRSNKGVSLTATGNLVYKFAENILRTYDEMMLELSKEDIENRIIKINATSSIADYSLPCTLIRANDVYPEHKYELTSNFTEEIVTNVSNNICDVGFYCDTGVELKIKESVVTKVGVNNIVLIANNDGAFPDKMNVDDLLNACLITFTGKNNISDILTKNLQKMGYSQNSLNCNLKVESIGSAKILVARKYGIAFLPYASVKEELYKEQFKSINIPDFNMNLDIMMMYKNNAGSHVLDFITWFIKHGSKSFC